MLQKACEQHGKQDLLHGSQEPSVPRLLMVSAVWKHLGFVGRDVPPKICECFWKYMLRSQTINFAIARPSWGLNQAPTSRQKGENKQTKKLQYTFLFSRRKDLTWMWEHKTGKNSSSLPKDSSYWFLYCFSHMEMTKAFSLWKLERAFNKT